MPSFISNSDIHLRRRVIPAGRWLVPLCLAMIIGLAAIVAEEVWLARRGFVPTVVDSASAWARERARASSLGDRAIILVGASRMQLDVDLETMAGLTGRPVVQLAIDGSSFVPVLAELASDDRVTGTVIVDYQDHVVGNLGLKDGSGAYLAEWMRIKGRSGLPDFTAAERWLTDRVHDHMRSFADGASPLDSLTRRLLNADATQQYLITLPSRERQADYSKVAMPQFYYARVMRNAEIAQVPPATSWQALDEALSSRISAMPARLLPAFDRNAEVIAGYVHRIEARGGHVIVVMFPRSGLVRAADEKRFPSDRYWSRFLEKIGVPGLDYRQVPAMAALRCPDGSHLDARDQVTFTRALVSALPSLRGGKMSSANLAAVRGQSEE